MAGVSDADILDAETLAALERAEADAERAGDWEKACEYSGKLLKHEWAVLAKADREKRAASRQQPAPEPPKTEGQS